jgi:hypothetical protein
MATLDIELYYDLDRRRWTTSAGGLATQPSLFIGQSNTIDFKVRFVQGGVPIELTNPSFIAGVKVTDDPLGDYLLLTTTGTQTGTGATTIYTFTLLIDSVELQAYLVGITPSTNSTAFEVRDTVNNIATLPAITCSILPDYTLTGATPAAGSGTLVVDSGATFTVHKTFAMPVDDGTDTYILQTDGAGVGSWVAKPSGGVTSVAQSFTGGIVSVSGSPITTSGTLALTVAGTSGGLVYFSSTSAWASSAVMGAGALVVGGGAGATPTALAAVASGRVLTSAGTSTTPAYSSTITLGASGTLGTITLGNATSGTILITPPTGALGTPTLTLPITSTTLAGLSVAQTFNAAQTFSSTVNLTLDTDATSSSAGGTLTVTGGAAVSKKLFVGTLLDLVATTSTAGQITQAGSRIFHTFGGTGNIWLGLTTGNTAGALTGTNNIAIGTQAGKSMTSGANNMLIGSSSGEFITSGFNNCCVGASAGYNIGAGTYNTAIGYVALQFGGSGGYNTAIGQGSLQNITSGTLNTCIGSDAGDDTSSVGGLTGANISSGANNTLIGALAASTSATGTYRTAIGSGSRCNVNNSIKLGRDHTASFVGDMVSLPSVLTANLPAATAAMAGAIIYVSDDGTGHINFCNGSSWARIN